MKDETYHDLQMRYIELQKRHLKLQDEHIELLEKYGKLLHDYLYVADRILEIGGNVDKEVVRMT